MPAVKMTGKVLKWGNSYGVRISKADFERAKLRVGQEVNLDLLGTPGKVDLSHLHFIKGPGKFPGWDHDDILYLDQLGKLHRNGQIKKAELDRERAVLEARNARR